MQYVDYAKLYEAVEYINRRVKKYTGCKVIWKEKYGTIRWEWILAPSQTIYSRSKLQHWWSNSWIANRWALFGWYMAGKAIQEAILVWPELEEALCRDFIVDTKFGKQCTAKYWSNYDD